MFIQDNDVIDVYNNGSLTPMSYKRIKERGFIIVQGKRGVGKSSYCREMSRHTRTVFLEIQRVSELPKMLVDKSLKIISILEDNK